MIIRGLHVVTDARAVARGAVRGRPPWRWDGGDPGTGEGRARDRERSAFAGASSRSARRRRALSSGQRPGRRGPGGRRRRDPRGRGRPPGPAARALGGPDHLLGGTAREPVRAAALVAAGPTTWGSGRRSRRRPRTACPIRSGPAGRRGGRRGRRAGGRDRRRDGAPGDRAAARPGRAASPWSWAVSAAPDPAAPRTGRCSPRLDPGRGPMSRGGWRRADRAGRRLAGVPNVACRSAWSTRHRARGAS